MAYVDYKFYTDTYLGNAVPEAQFNRLAERASEYLDWITRGQAANAEEEKLKKAACAVAEAFQINEQGGDVISQTVGSWSKSYSKTSKTDAQRLLEAAQKYLQDLIPKARWA